MSLLRYPISKILCNIAIFVSMMRASLQSINICLKCKAIHRIFGNKCSVKADVYYKEYEREKIVFLLYLKKKKCGFVLIFHICFSHRRDKVVLHSKF